MRVTVVLPALEEQSIRYEASDIPEGMTLREFRARRVRAGGPPEPHRVLRRLIRLEWAG